MKWISVEDRLPEDGQEIIVFDNDRDAPLVTSAWYDTRRSKYNNHTSNWVYAYDELGDVCLDHVTYWQPLPEKPAGYS